jgi:hypothetical protein
LLGLDFSEGQSTARPFYHILVVGQSDGPENGEKAVESVLPFRAYLVWPNRLSSHSLTDGGIVIG